MRPQRLTSYLQNYTPSPDIMATPYTEGEELAWRTLVRNQATELRRENGEVLLALGFGAGQATEDIAVLTGEHVLRVQDGVEIAVLFSW